MTGKRLKVVLIALGALVVVYLLFFRKKSASASELTQPGTGSNSAIGWQAVGGASGQPFANVQAEQPATRATPPLSRTRINFSTALQTQISTAALGLQRPVSTISKSSISGLT